jgi:hypothetical protein
MKKYFFTIFFACVTTPCLLFAYNSNNHFESYCSTHSIFSFTTKVIRDSSTYKIERSEIKDKEFSLVSIQIFEVDGNHNFPFAICILRDKKYNALVSVNSDKDGKIELHLSDFIHLKTLSITSLGYQTVDIPLKVLKGYRNNIVVLLAPDLDHPLE